MKTIELIQQLSNLPGVSGFEDQVVDFIKEEMEEKVKVEEDTLRNLYLHHPKNTGNRMKVMLDAHSDEVGFMVQAIKSNGMIKFLPLGGWVANNVPTSKVKIRNSEGEYITGIVASKPPHFMTEAEKAKPVAIADMVIDVGATCREEVLELYKIEVGAPIVPDVTSEYKEATGIIMGKAFDNRLGSGLIMKTMEALINEELEIDVVGAIAAQEEVGTRGAAVTSNHVKPTVAIVFEGTPADDLYRDQYEAQSVLKKGPQIRHRDRSMISHPRFTKFARDIAKKEGIPFQDAVRIGGGTNGGKIHLSNEGVPCIVIGVPVRYIHTHHGYMAVQDFDQALAWAVAVIRQLNQNVIKGF